MNFHNPVHRHYGLVVLLVLVGVALMQVVVWTGAEGFAMLLLGWFIIMAFILRRFGVCQHCGEKIPHVKWFGFSRQLSPRHCSNCHKAYSDRA